MFKELSALTGMIGKIPQIKEEWAKFQAKAGDLTAEGAAGGDMVKVTANGRLTITKVRLSDEALRLQDKEVLEDLIAAACSQALERVRKLLADEASRVAGEIGLPPGISLPGLV